MAVAVADDFSYTLAPLFQKVAPTYNYHFILGILTNEFSRLSSSELITRVSEFLKFAYIRSFYQDEESFVPVKKPIDEIWHEFIVQTRDYEKFCQALPGKFFLHHTTVHLDELGNQRDQTQLVKEMLAWIPRYLEHFGHFTEESAEYWLMPSFLKEKLNLNLEQINQLSLA